VAKKKSATRKRSTARKAAPAKRTKAAKKRPKKAARRSGLDLKKLKTQLEKIVTALDSLPAARTAAYPGEGIDFARSRMSDWILNIDQICGRGDCGPDMIFPPPS
jgi:hypothetical protein